MTAGLRSLVSLSFLSGLSLWLCPEGNAKRVMRILCTAVLISALVAPLGDFDLNAFLLDEEKLDSAQAEIINNSAQRVDLLRKLLFQKNCESYIEERGISLGLRDIRAVVILDLNADGALVPYKAIIDAVGSLDSAGQLRSLICDNLGIPAERQDWTLDEG